MSSKISGYSAITSVQADDLLPVVDVHDTSMAPSGTTKKMTLSQLPFAGLLTPVAVKTSAYAAAAGNYVPCDTTSAGFTVTLPNAPADLTVVGVKHVIQGGTNVLTVACAGSDVYNKAGGGTSATLSLASQGILVQYSASGGIWYVVSDDLPLTQLDARYVRSVTAADTSVVIGGTGTAPTVRTGTLDVVATQHPPAASVPMNSQKFTGLANGSAAADSAAYGQTPAGGNTATIGQGGTGQTTVAAAYNALSPMTAKGDMEYDSAAGAAARLAVGSAGQVLGVSGGVPAWGMGLTLLAATSLSGYALVNGTGTIISWTAPSDGALHRFIVFSNKVVTSTETGGQIQVAFTDAASVSVTTTPFGGGQGTGFQVSGNTALGGCFVPAGTTVTVKQSSALTAGASTLWAEIWGS